jgi:uncharacterized protein (TIGR03118 family)
MYVAYNNSDGTGSYGYGGPLTGLIDVFDQDGYLLQRLVPNNSHLNLPWGLAVTGANFGSFSYALVVGNFGDGTISAFDLNSGDYLGTMQGGKGNNISINGLWGLQWGNGGSGGDASTLYFAASPGAGPSGYSQHGLFGSLMDCQEISVSTSGQETVVPVAMKLVSPELELGHLLVGNL